MNKNVREAKFYDDRVKLFGKSIKSVGWSSVEQQFLRFDILLRGAPFTLDSILDTGCGLGDLLTYLDERGFKYHRYIGIDISNEMINIAKKEHRSTHTKFICSDFKKLRKIKCFSYIIMSGSLNLKTNSKPLQRVDLFFKKSASLLRQDGVVAANFLSIDVDFQQNHHQHYSALDVFKLAHKHFNEVEIRDNYGLYEFTILGRSPHNEK